MAFAKGNPGGPGRPKGIPNKTTEIVKRAIAKALEGSAPMVQEWLKQTGEADPFKGVQAFATLAEFVAPKLGRQEVSGPEGGPLEVVIRDIGKEQE